MAARRKPDPEPPAPEPTRLEAAQARFHAADAAVERAQATVTEMERRLVEAEAHVTASNAACGAASFAAVEDPGASGLLDDAVLQSLSAEKRRDLLLKNTLPAARLALPPREEEREKARVALNAEILRLVVRDELIAADQAFVQAANAAGDALADAQRTRESIRQRFGLGPDAFPPLGLAVPVSLAALGAPRIAYGPGGSSVTEAVVGGDLIAKHLLAFDLEPEDVA